MEPCLAENDKLMFYKYLEKSRTYFEYGSGGSTYQATLRENITKMYSVESDSQWHNKLKTILNNNNKVCFIYNEMDTQPNNLGYPGPKSTEIQCKTYSEHILLLNENERKNIDLVLIDGRFRVACCLKSFQAINNECLIAFDDFLDRPHYHIVLNYFDIVEKTQDNRMVILKKKEGINFVPEEIIKNYELISS